MTTHPPGHTMPDLLTAREGVRAMLRLLSLDPDSPAVVDTPRRVVDAMLAYNPPDESLVDDLLAVTFDGCDVDEVILVGPVDFTSLCEHHLLPFHGHGWLAYIPAGGRVVGLSKLPRLLDHYACRPQMQERLTEQVADAIDKHLDPLAVAVILTASHTCMALRGAKKPGAVMTTSSMRGAFRNEPEARAELLSLIGALR